MPTAGSRSTFSNHYNSSSTRCRSVPSTDPAAGVASWGANEKAAKLPAITMPFSWVTCRSKSFWPLCISSLLRATLVLQLQQLDCVVDHTLSSYTLQMCPKHLPQLMPGLYLCLGGCLYCSRKANKLPICCKLVNCITEPWQLPKLTRVEVCVLHQAIEQL